MGIVGIIALIFWAILGLIFWIPLLFRIVAAFCGNLIYNMIVNNPERILQSKSSLELAINFYSRGFEIISSTIYEKPKETVIQGKNEFHISSFIGQLIWTLLFWGLTIYPFYKNSINTYIKTIGYTNTRFVEESNKLLAVHDTLNAVRMISIAIDREKYNADLYLKRGMLLSCLKDYYRAVNDLESAILLDSVKYGKDPELYYKIGGILCWELEEYQKALPYFTKYIQNFPNNSNTFFCRAYCYSKTEESEKAISDYNTTLALDPKSSAAFNNLALLLIDKGQKEEACELFEKGIALGNKKAIENKKKFCN